MKRCPECRRDYFDDSLLYCLDDGADLLEGPASTPGLRDEPQTAILHETNAPSKAGTQAQLHTTNMPRFVDKSIALTRNSARPVAAAAALAALLAVGGFFGLRYFRSDARQISSIAVMPFTNESGNADLEYLSDGMTDTMISSLSQLPNLTVKARSAVFRYKGTPVDAKTVGVDLNAQAILNGRVTARSDQLTVNVELIDAQTENVIWAHQYDRKQADLLAIQKEITRDVIAKLSTKLSGADEQKLAKTPTADPEAYRLLLQARYFLDHTTREDTEKAVGYFQQAIAIDASCAVCWADLARAYAIQAGRAWVPQADGFDRARDAAKRSLAIDPDLAEGYAQLGRVQAAYDLDLKGAEASYRRALELSTSNSSSLDGAAVLYYKLGRFDEAFEMSRKALLQDPVNSGFYHNLGLTYFAQGKLDESEHAFRKALELVPKRNLTNAFLALVLLEEKRSDDSLTQALAEPDEFWRQWALAIVFSKLGRKADSDAALKKLTEKAGDNDGFQIAEVYAQRGESDKAFQWLESALDKRDPGVTHAKADPILAPLHDDPRWPGFLKKLGLDQ